MMAHCCGINDRPAEKTSDCGLNDVEIIKKNGNNISNAPRPNIMRRRSRIQCVLPVVMYNGPAFQEDASGSKAKPAKRQ